VYLIITVFGNGEIQYRGYKGAVTLN